MEDIRGLGKGPGGDWNAHHPTYQVGMLVQGMGTWTVTAISGDMTFLRWAL